MSYSDSLPDRRWRLDVVGIAAYTYSMPTSATMPSPIMDQLNQLVAGHNSSSYKVLNLYFTHDERFADSFITAERKGSGFLHLQPPQPGSRPEVLTLSITMRPGVFLEQWAGYSLTMNNTPGDGYGAIQMFRYWPEDPTANPATDSYRHSEFDVDPALLPRLLPYVEALMQLPVTTIEPAREAPSTMF